MNVIEKKIINDAFMNVITKGQFPEYGSPETRCSKCMFYKVACTPSGENVVGCFHGWKKEKV